MKSSRSRGIQFVFTSECRVTRWYLAFFLEKWSHTAKERPEENGRIQGCTKSLFPGCVKFDEKVAFFHPIFTQPGKCLLVHPCTVAHPSPVGGPAKARSTSSRQRPPSCSPSCAAGSGGGLRRSRNNRFCRSDRFLRSTAY